MKKRIILVAMLVFSLLFYSREVFASEYLSASELYTIGKELLYGYLGDATMADEDFCNTAGTSFGDWLVIGSCQMGLGGAGEAYALKLSGVIDDIYSKDLSLTKATDFQRISLTLMALDKNALDFNGHNLVSDGSFNRGLYQSLDKQGINSWCFALIALNSSGYLTGSDDFYSEDAMISRILEHQLGNGAFAMTGMGADVDITAMAIQALAPKSSHENVSEAIEAAVNWLSSVMQDDGDFMSLGSANCESTAQVIIALTCLGINPQTDARFIKNGNNVVDGLLKYRTEEGAFCHVIKDDTRVVNALSTAQGMCALSSLFRFEAGYGSLYDFSVRVDNSQYELPADYSDEESTEESYDTEYDTEETQKEMPESSEKLTSEGENTTTVYEEADGLTDFPEDKDNRPSSALVYILALFAASVGIISLVIMKRKGRER